MSLAPTGESQGGQVSWSTGRQAPTGCSPSTDLVAPQTASAPSSPPDSRRPSPSSRLARFFRWLLSPLFNLFLTLYNIVSRRLPRPKPDPGSDKAMENQKPGAANRQIDAREDVVPRLSNGVANLTLRDAAAPIFPPAKAAAIPLVPVVPAGAPLRAVDWKEEEDEDPARKAERALHQGFIEEALDMARLALRTNETPVGCVLVYKGRVIAKGMNATNITRNGTRHAEYMALSSLFSLAPGVPPPGHPSCKHDIDDPGEWDAVDPSNGYLYPYGQKLHPSPRVTTSIVHESTLYVTVEPCVMCASLLRQLGIKKVYFGAVNDKFGGTGGVFRVNINSSPASNVLAQPTRRVMGGRIVRIRRDGTETNLEADDANSSGSSQQASGSLDSRPRPLQQSKLPVSSSNATSSGSSSAPFPAPPRVFYRLGQATQIDTQWKINPEPVVDPPQGAARQRDGDGGNVERGYDAEGGWGRDEAVTLLRQFYVQENGRAPVPRKKEGRAARLAAMMEKEVMSPTIELKNTPASAPVTVAGTPTEGEDGQEVELSTGGVDGMIDVPTPMSEVA